MIDDLLEKIIQEAEKNGKPLEWLEGLIEDYLQKAEERGYDRGYDDGFESGYNQGCPY